MDNRLKTGIVYIGNLPFGLFEESLRDFLSQFGEILHLKVKRSDKNANPMGYAYVEFTHRKVAAVVANTMNNYLMFSKLLKCKMVYGDSKKIFRKRDLKPELCSGTRHKRRNQYKLENVKEEKVLKKLKQSKAKLSKVLGMKIGPRFLIQNSICEDLENKNVESSEGELPDKFVSREGKHTSHDTISITKKKQKIGEKGAEKESIKTRGEALNSQSKTLVKKMGDPVVKPTKETPIYMDIEDEDDEIQLKTPPNVIKRYKKSVKIDLPRKRILGSNKVDKSIKKNDLLSLSNDANQAVETYSKKLKKTSMKIKKNGKLLKSHTTDKILKNKIAKKSESSGKISKNKIVNKSDSNKSAKNKIVQKSSIKSQELKANEFSNVIQHHDQRTECLSPKVPGKFVKLKRKAESVEDDHTVKSKKFKLNKKNIKEEGNQKPEATNKIAKKSKFTGKVKVAKNKRVIKSDSSKTAKNKIRQKSSKKCQELKANEFSNVIQSTNQGTDYVSPKIPGKFLNQKRKAESVKVEKAVKSKTFKLNSKKIKEMRKPNSKSPVKLVSFKKKTAKA